MFNPLNTPNYQVNLDQFGGSTRPQTSQPAPLTGAAPLTMVNFPDPNTTAPDSSLMDPNVQNMIKALQGGQLQGGS